MSTTKADHDAAKLCGGDYRTGEHALLARELEVLGEATLEYPWAALGEGRAANGEASLESG